MSVWKRRLVGLKNITTYVNPRGKAADYDHLLVMLNRIDQSKVRQITLCRRSSIKLAEPPIKKKTPNAVCAEGKEQLSTIFPKTGARITNDRLPTISKAFAREMACFNYEFQELFNLQFDEIFNAEDFYNLACTLHSYDQMHDEISIRQAYGLQRSKDAIRAFFLATPACSIQTRSSYQSHMQKTLPKKSKPSAQSPNFLQS